MDAGGCQRRNKLGFRIMGGYYSTGWGSGAAVRDNNDHESVGTSESGTKWFPFREAGANRPEERGRETTGAMTRPSIQGVSPRPAAAWGAPSRGLRAGWGAKAQGPRERRQVQPRRFAPVGQLSSPPGCLASPGRSGRPWGRGPHSPVGPDQVALQGSVKRLLRQRLWAGTCGSLRGVSLSY